ncbi:hypothetical protein EMCRGX_G018184 [Ephydatia muelleri]
MWQIEVASEKEMHLKADDLLGGNFKAVMLSPSSGFVGFPGAIPPNEIWIKAGGVKGGGTFKFCLKLLNVEAPNSSEKTSVISMFEGPDSVTNMHICLDQYVEQLAEINQMTWREKKIRLFLCGDYEFLCHCHGLSGRHCCLHCLTTSNELQLQPFVESLDLRTIDSILHDNSYKQYCSDVKMKQDVMEKLHIVKESIQTLEEILISPPLPY